MDEMKMIKTIPLSKNIPKEFLTYFSLKNISVGDIVSIPVKNKTHNALVVEITKLDNEKSSIKSASFRMKKIEKIKGSSFLNDGYVESAIETSKFYVTTSGSILDIVIPEILLKQYDKISQFIKKIGKENSSNLIQEKIVFQAPETDRMSLYKTYIRESFAKKTSVYICLPTVNEIEKYEKYLEKGIEQYTISIHSDLTQKDSLSKIKKIVTSIHPILIIGTVPYLSLPRSDIGTIILEKESSSSYKSIGRPYLDLRTFVEIFSYFKKIKLILGDNFLRPETTYRYEQGEFSDIPPFSFRVNALKENSIIETKDKRDTGNKWAPISTETLSFIEEIIEKKTRGFFFNIRKGLAPITVCGDCGKTHLCEFCSSPVSLYERDNERIYICNKCKNEQNPKILCTYCGSWNLVPLGIGTGGIKEFLKKNFPELTIFILDKESIHSHNEAVELVNEFYKTKKAILIGTELALHYLKEKIHTTGIVSLDSLYALPTFRINEKVIYLIESMRNISENSFFIQTKNKDSLILKSYKSGTLINIYRNEISERKHFNYPPFARLIKISFIGNIEGVKKAREFLEKTLTEYNPEFFEAFTAKIGGMQREHALIKIDPKSWSVNGLSKKPNQDQNLYTKLESLPRSFNIQIDPEDLL